MSNRGEEQKGPIRRYRRGDRYRRPSKKGSDHAQLDTDGGEPSPLPASTMGAPQEPQPTITPTFPPPSTFQFQPVRQSSRSSGSWLRWLIIGGSIAVVVVAVAIPIISVSNTIHAVTPLFRVNTPTPTPSAPSATSTTSAPVRHASYLTTPGLRAGLTRIVHQAPGARVALLRIAKDSLSVTVKRPSGAVQELIFAPTGTVTVSVPTLGERAIPISQVRPRAVARLIAGMRARFHVPASRIDYIVLSTPPGVPTQWIVFTKAPGHPGYTATLAGTKLARLPG